MKEALHKHIENILEALGAQDIAVRISDCELDPIPTFICQQEPTNSFLVCCTYKIGLPDPAWLNRLQSFIGKELFMSATRAETHVYWFENKSGETTASGSPVKEHPSAEGEMRYDEFVVHAKLPEYIDNIIYDLLEATYAPDFAEFSDNLTHTKEKVLVYLGTYFPRSFAESFCIFKNMLQNDTIQAAFKNKTSLNILSIGCGTGGELFGLLSLLAEQMPNIENITSFAVDGNAESITILKKIYNKLHRHLPFNIKLKTYIQIFEEKISSSFLKHRSVKFDCIISSKMLGELIRNNKMCKNSYYDFCKEFLPYMSDDGICLIVDVTTQTNERIYLPILLNSQINKAIQELCLYKTLLPLPCNLYECQCDNNNCFSQKIFTVEHRKHNKDTSKVCYRIIAHKNFCDSVKTVIKDIKYNISDSNICQYTASYQIGHDGYNIGV